MLKTFRELWQQLVHLWVGADLRSRVVFSVAVGLSIAATLAVGFWSSRPEFVPLARDLPTDQAGRVKAQLDAAGIPNKLNFDASAVLVPKGKWNVARLAVQDSLGDLAAEEPQIDPSPWSDPRTVHQRLLHRQELHLAQTIKSWHGVADAKVHLAKPEPSVFVRQQAPVTASVVLQLKPRSGFSPDQAATIAAMVAGAVEGLEPENVTVMDTEGRVLASGGQSLSNVSQQLAYKRELEADLAAKAQSILDATLGPGRAVVRVVADVDFTSSVRTDTTFDPDLKVRTKETSVSWQSSGASSIALGPAGASSNFSASGAPAPSSTQPSSSKGEQVVTEFENAVSESRTEQAPGRLRRLTVAATVDVRSLTEATTAGAAGNEPDAAPTAALTQTEIEGLIKSTVGFDESRGDEIKVVLAPLLGTTVVEEDLETLQQWHFYRDLARNVSLGVAALAALLIGLLVIRRLHPGPHAGLELARMNRQQETLSLLARRVEENPEAMRAVIEAWLGDTGEAGKQGPARRAA